MCRQRANNHLIWIQNVTIGIGNQYDEFIFSIFPKFPDMWASYFLTVFNGILAISPTLFASILTCGFGTSANKFFLSCVTASRSCRCVRYNCGVAACRSHCCVGQGTKFVNIFWNQYDLNLGKNVLCILLRCPIWSVCITTSIASGQRYVLSVWPNNWHLICTNYTATVNSRWIFENFIKISS